MTVLRLLVLATICIPAAPQESGMIPRWQVEEMATGVVANADTALNLVEPLQPADWVANGAPLVYVDQHRVLIQELENVKLAALALGRDPERLTYAVDTFLWLDRADALQSSVTDATRRYYNGAVADLLDSARNRNAEVMETLKTYMRQLAVHVESSMAVAHKEAQRCREEIVAKPR